MKYLLLTPLFIVFCFVSRAQSLKEITIGEMAPDISFNRVLNNGKDTVLRLSDFKDKLVIIDMWSTNCSGCIASFPKMEALQKKFGDKIQILLVNANNDKYNTTEKVLETLDKTKQHNGFYPSLLIPIHDTILNSYFPHKTVPHHIWIDGSGTVLYVTHGYNATPEHIQAVLNGEKPNMRLKNDKDGMILGEKGYLQPTIADMPSFSYSAIIPYYDAGASISNRTDSVRQLFKHTVCNLDVISLYSHAFSLPIINELSDSLAFARPKDPNKWDRWKSEYTFTYEIQLPLRDKDKWQTKMQVDLNYFFGNKFNIEGRIEKRTINGGKTPVDVLVIRDKQKS